jgi:hypothetical protein
MINTLRSKTLSASLPGDPHATFDWIADPRNLPNWYGSLGRPQSVRFIRDDRARLLDLVVNLGGIELSIAIRVLANGDGCEIVLTLIQPRGLPDVAFQEHARWAERALGELKNIPQAEITQAASPAAEPPSRTSGLWSAVRAALSPAAASPLAPSNDAVAERRRSTTPDVLPTPAASGRKLYVGNLPYAWTEEQLRELFSGQGSVITAEIARFGRRNGRSRGFGFVVMSTEAEAQTAIEKLHEALAGDRKIVVRLARSREHNAPADTAVSAETSASPLTARTRGGRARTPRPGRGRPSARSSPSDRPSPRRESEPPARRTGISNNSGYEIYPRDAKGGFSSEPTARSAAPPSSSTEPSPYMEDTGDIENRGNRPSRRRRR